MIAEKLGVKPNHIAIGNVESNYSEVEFMVFIDENAGVKEDKGLIDFHRIEIRRNKL